MGRGNRERKERVFSLNSDPLIYILTSLYFWVVTQPLKREGGEARLQVSLRCLEEKGGRDREREGSRPNV